MDYQKYLRIARRAARAAGKVIQGFTQTTLDIQTKGEHYNLVTAADVACEETIVKTIRGAFPDHNILAEEKDYGKTSSPFTWVIDPIDGTSNFAHGFPHFAVSIALAYNGEVVAGVVLFPLGFSGQFFKIDLAGLNNAMGNGHWQSAVYALFDSIFSVGLSMGAIVVFRRFVHRESRVGGFLARQSYAVYLLHIPVVVFLGYAMRRIQLPNLLKFGLAALLMIPASFVVAWLVRKVPLVSRVL